MRKVQIKSILRVLPAAVLGLLPMSFVDNRILEFEYQLRGARRLTDKIVLVTLPTSPRKLPDSFEIRAPNCIDLSGEALLLSPCKRIDLSNKFSTTSIADLQIELSDAFGQILKKKKIVSADDLLYSGRSTVFQQITLEEFLKLDHPTFPEDTFVVLISKDYKTGPLLTTPMGVMNQIDVFLNFLANLLEERSLQRGNIFQQALLSLASIALTSYFVYFLPTAITLIYLLGLFLFLVLCSFISFETLDFQLLIAGPLFSSIMTYILGISDRLDQRDRFEWTLNREKEGLLRLDEMRNNFLSLISHDLKTPIAKIQAICERLIHQQNPELSSQQRDEIQKILSANKEMFRNISSLLLLSRIEAQEFQLRREPTDLVAILEDVVNSQGPLAEKKHIRIRKEFTPLFLVDLDQGLIREVASNLLGNALKYSPEGSEIVIRCGDQDNDQALLPPQPSVWFEVQDSGPGIPEQEQKRVFEKFFRGENAPADQPDQGSGLGLYLSAFFVEKHNGKILLYSKSLQDPETPSEDLAVYFPKGVSGTVMRVALPQESLYD